jgi:hypothetical protein
VEAEGTALGVSRLPVRDPAPCRRNQRRGPFSLAITSCDTAVRYAFSDDRAGLLLLYNISQSLIFRNRTGACIIMPLGVLLSFSWAAIHHPLSAAYQHRPA